MKKNQQGFILYLVLVWMMSLASVMLWVENQILRVDQSVRVWQLGEQLIHRMPKQLETYVQAGSLKQQPSQQCLQTTAETSLAMEFQPWQAPIEHVLMKSTHLKPYVQRCAEIFINKETLQRISFRELSCEAEGLRATR